MEQNKIIPPTSGSNISEPFERKLDKLKETIESLNAKKASGESYYDVRNSYEYLRGFYDATHNFMQTFTRLIELEELRHESE